MTSEEADALLPSDVAARITAQAQLTEEQLDTLARLFRNPQDAA